MGHIHDVGQPLLDDSADVLQLDAKITECLRDGEFPCPNFTVPLAGRSVPFCGLGRADRGPGWRCQSVMEDAVMRARLAVFVQGGCNMAQPRQPVDLHTRVWGQPLEGPCGAGGRGMRLFAVGRAALAPLSHTVAVPSGGT